MDISNIAGLYSSGDPEKIRKNSAQEQQKKEKSKAVEKNVQADEVNISSAAKEAFNDRSLEKMVKDLPAERKNEIDEAKRKVDSGELLSEENISATADRILKGFISD